LIKIQDGLFSRITSHDVISEDECRLITTSCKLYLRYPTVSSKTLPVMFFGCPVVLFILSSGQIL